MAKGLINAEAATTDTRCTFWIYDGTNKIGTAFGSADASHLYGTSVNVIGEISYTSFQSTKTFTLYAVRNAGDGYCQAQAGDANTGVSLSIEEVYPTQSQPVFINSVGTSYPGNTFFESARSAAGNETTECTTGTCTLYRNSGAFTSSTFIAQGRYTVNFDSSKLGSDVVCGCSNMGTLGGGYTCIIDTYTSSSFRVVNYNAANTSYQNDVINFWCHGKK